MTNDKGRIELDVKEV